MANYTVMNPGKHHLGIPFSFPPVQNRKYIDRNIIQEMRWKTSILLNRRIYVGNVQVKDVDGKVENLSDSIFKTKSNKFDTFTMDRRIDVAVGDGEEIIRLAGFADRLLQFKQNTLHIINVSGQSEYLESTHKFKGVQHHNQVCETDYGIAWCNAHGVYFYDGKEVQDLFIKQGVKRIDSATWNGFYDEDETMIGYVPKDKHLILAKNVTNSGDIMMYDMITTAWTKGTTRLAATEKTNFENFWNGSLIYGSETSDGVASAVGKLTVAPWSVTPTKITNGYQVETKELNFGTQAQKKVTKVRITYRGANGANTNILPKYAVDGGLFDNSFKDASGDAVTSANSVGVTRKLQGGTNWKEITLHTDSSVANNIRSFAIQLTEGPEGDVASDFEVNDITIIYRNKSVK
jgi:hypothetical protein|tara:strand:+ start:2053 stop:3267 length:1215 start_codon:yes stop_codon:yes gene_type:complete